MGNGGNQWNHLFKAKNGRSFPDGPFNTFQI